MIDLNKENPWGANLILSKEDPWGINYIGIAETVQIKKEVADYIEEWLIDISRQSNYQTHEETFMYQLKELDYSWNLKNKVLSTEAKPEEVSKIESGLEKVQDIKDEEVVSENFLKKATGKVLKSVGIVAQIASGAGLAGSSAPRHSRDGGRPCLSGTCCRGGARFPRPPGRDSSGSRSRWDTPP